MMKTLILIFALAACSTHRGDRNPSGESTKKLKCVEYSQTNRYGISLEKAMEKLAAEKEIKYPNLEAVGGSSSNGCAERYVDVYTIQEQNYRTNLELQAGASENHCVYNTVSALNEGEYPYGYVCEKNKSHPVVKGEIELSQKVENQGTLRFSGAVAKTLWDGMSDVKVNKPSQFNPHAFKQGRSVRCFDYSSTYECFVNIEDMKDGIFGEFE